MIVQAMLTESEVAEYLEVGQESPPLLFCDGSGHASLARTSGDRWVLREVWYSPHVLCPPEVSETVLRSASEVCDRLLRLEPWREA